MSSVIRLALVGLGLAAPRLAAAVDCSDAGVGTLGFALVEHSCFHAELGPFGAVVATAGASPSAATPNVDPVHTYFAVTVTPDQENAVTYRPARSGNWALFGAAGVPHRVLDETGAALPVLLAHPVADCPALPVVQVFPLVANTRYTIVIGPTAAATTPLVLEKVSDFEELHGRDGDGDGFGDEADSILTPCAPPEGYVRNVSDCDDTAADVHPEAAEVCDGDDENCNGIADEEACTTGGGGCATAAVGPDGGGGALILLLSLAGVAVAARRRE